MQTARRKWARHVRDWRRSGLTAAEYAASFGINAGTLSHWAWRLGRDARQRRTPASSGASGSEPSSPLIEVIAAPSRVPEFSVELSNGRRVHVPQKFDGGALERLLRVLEAAK